MSDMVRRDGIVVHSAPGVMRVRLEKEREDCDGCHSCALKNLCSSHASGHIEVDVATNEVRRPGDPVTILYHSANPAMAAFVLFFPALAGLCGGGYLARMLWGAGDMVFVGGALVGAALGVGATYIVNRVFRATAPKITLVE